MADLTTSYLGLTLQNPLIVGSSSITQSLQDIRHCEEKGAGAVVLKSLFEEQIHARYEQTRQNMIFPWHPEIYDMIEHLNIDYGPREYLNLITEAKKAITIPVIASIHCYSDRYWIEFARQIEAAGADAIELNMHIFPVKRDTGTAEIEKTYHHTVQLLQEKIALPIALKLSPHFTNLFDFAVSLDRLGINGLVLFNRFTPFDINIETLEPTSGPPFSQPNEKYTALRWIALLSDNLKCDLVASTGNHSGADVIKQLLAGATAVQLCSVLYCDGIEVISKILQELTEWMNHHQFDSIAQFRGLLNQKKSQKPETFERFQFIQASIRYLAELSSSPGKSAPKIS
ncbi:MAG: dihydroorotate dehydrogenase-like protein [Fidelibacterota bacterium]